MRQIDEKHTITDDGKLIKTATGEEIPEIEPVILYRGRDRLALPMLRYYRTLCVADGATEYQLQSMDRMIEKFQKYADENPTKQPGITQGAPWDGKQS
jgi:hypothetical protein